MQERLIPLVCKTPMARELKLVGTEKEPNSRAIVLSLWSEEPRNYVFSSQTLREKTKVFRNAKAFH